MPQITEVPLRLIILDDSAENAETLVSSLRNYGVTVRPHRPTTPAELAELLRGQVSEMVLASQSCTSVPPDQAVAVIASSGRDIPVILLADTVDEDLILRITSMGMSGLALRRHPENVLAMTQHVFTNLQARRSLRRIEAQMRETERRCDALIASSRDPIAYIHEGMHIRANEAYLEMFGYENFEDVEGISILDMVAPSHLDDFKQLLRSLSKGEAPPQEYRLDAVRMDGERFPAIMEFSGAQYEGEPCLQVIFRRNNEFNPELAREVETLRNQDLATGLLNRSTMMVRLEDAVTDVTRSESQYVFLLVQPDHTTRLLQEIGLAATDALATALANVLTAACGEAHQLARLGELTFAVLARANWEQANNLASTVLRTFAESLITVGSNSLAITVSIGGVLIGEHLTSPSRVLQRSNQCLESASGHGGNAHEIFDPAAADRLEQERAASWLAHLCEAIDNDSFVLHYQPVLNLAGDQTQRYDAFVRLNNRGELVSPASFIAIAEENGLLADINRCVVRMAIRKMGERQRAGNETRIGIRISPESFNDPLFLRVLRDELSAASVPGDRLLLQIAESKVFTHLRAAQQFQAEVAAHGCHLILDQFGIGLDSFQLLGHLKPYGIKLDRSFTADYSALREQQSQVEAITSRAQSLGIVTIAEFISDAQTMSLLFTSGVDFVQGDFIGPALPEMNYEFS